MYCICHKAVCTQSPLHHCRCLPLGSVWLFWRSLVMNIPPPALEGVGGRVRGGVWVSRPCCQRPFIWVGGRDFLEG